jgi:hypothetical protein
MTPRTRLVLKSVAFAAFVTCLMIWGSGSLELTDVIIRMVIGVVPGLIFYFAMKSYAENPS